MRRSSCRFPCPLASPQACLHTPTTALEQASRWSLRRLGLAAD
jgi:hypothetical protein